MGDGTTSVVLLAGEFLKQMKPFIEEGVHPRIIIKALRRALRLAVDKINELSVKIDKSDLGKHINLLEECAATSMSSKLIHQQKKHFSELVVKAVLMLDDLLPLNMIGIKKVRLIMCFLVKLKNIQFLTKISNLSHVQITRCSGLRWCAGGL